MDSPRSATKFDLYASGIEFVFPQSVLVDHLHSSSKTGNGSVYVESTGGSSQRNIEDLESTSAIKKMKGDIKNEKKKKRWVLFGALFVCSLTVAVCSVIFMPMIYDAITGTVIDNMMVLNPSSSLYKEWKDPPLPLYSSFYIFNVENPDAILEGQKPVVTEKGPYVYRVETPRKNVTLNGNGTITSTLFYTYYFEPTLSIGPDTDVFTMVNPIAVATSVLSQDLSPTAKRQLSRAMDLLNETIFMNRSVNDILWGYDDGFLTLVDKFITIPGWDTNQFGLLWGRNESGLGLYTMYDGTENQSMLNQFDHFDYQPQLNWWYTPQANMLNGTDGTMFHPYIDRSEIMEMFHPDICRSIPFLYEKDINFNTVPLYKFVLANYTYANGTVHPPNAGFFKEGMSVPSGVLRQDPCRFGTPMGLSSPHFYDGDPWLYESIDGLSPNKESHESYLAIEQKMGMPYIFKLKLQVNNYMKPIEDIRQMENVPEVYFPLVWFEQSVEADDYIISMYTKGFVTTEVIMDSFQWFIFSVGVIVAIYAAYTMIRWYLGDDHEQGKEEDDAFGNEAFVKIEDQDKLSIDNEVQAHGQVEKENGTYQEETEMTTEKERGSSTENEGTMEQNGSKSPECEGGASENGGEMPEENVFLSEDERLDGDEVNVAYEDDKL